MEPMPPPRQPVPCVVHPSLQALAAPPLRVGVIENDERFLAILIPLLNPAAGCRCVCHFLSGEAVTEASNLHEVDVFLVDLELPGISGAETILRLRQIHPAAQFLVLTTFDDPQRVFEALRMGAAGYLLKRESIERIIKAIHEVAQGGAPMSPHIARMVLEWMHESSPMASEALAARENEVLELARRGQTAAETAQSLGISLATVRKYFSTIYQKLHVHSKADALFKTKWRGFRPD